MTQTESEKTFSEMVRAKGEGNRMKVLSTTIPKDKFTSEQLGLTDKYGNPEGPAWRMLAQKKAPGTNNMLDEIYFDPNKKTRYSRREDMINYIMGLFNRGKNPSNTDLKVKVMLLAKKNKQIVDQLQDVRMICIS